MEKIVQEVLGPLFTPITKCGEQIGNILADTIEKVFEEIEKKRIEKK